MGPLTTLANYSLIGVDIFMLLSAYGLCYSINKNSIKEFYKRRYSRVVPLYIILVGVVLTHNLLMGGAKTVDILGASTTLFIWGVGDIFFDWYLTAILYFYLAFPLFYKALSKYGLLAYFVLSMAFLSVAWYLPTTWFQNSALCRVPIFLAGIQIYVAKRKSIATSLMLSFFFLLTCFSYITGKVCLTYYMAPFVISLLIAFAYIINKIEKVKAILEYIGKYTLELYVANCLAMKLVPLSSSILGKYMIYYGVILTLTILFGWINKRIQWILNA